MNRKYFYLSLIAILLISNLLFLFFTLQKGRGLHHEDRPKNIVINKLNFDDQQIAQYQKLIDEHRENIRLNDQKINELKKELYRHLMNEGNSQMIDSLTTAIGLIQKNIETTHFQHFQDIKSICRQDQMIEYKDLVRELNAIFSKNPPQRKLK